MKKNIRVGLLLVLVGLFISPQDFFASDINFKRISPQLKFKPRKGSFYLNWGYNRSFYRNTNIEFKGKGFDFRLEDVSAHDVPEKFSAKVYLDPTKFTIPQFDFRMGYFISEKYSVSVGWDHMKYRVTENQAVRIDGYVDESVSPEHAGVFNGETILLSPDFIRLEHSDGLNFVRVGLELHNDIKLGLRPKRFRYMFGDWRLQNVLSVSAGLAMPWTDTHMFGTRYKNWVHVAGWGVSGIMGLRLHYRNNLYLQYRVQMGYLHMGDILLQDELDSRAKHDVKFTELSVSLGYNFGRRKNKEESIPSK